VAAIVWQGRAAETTQANSQEMLDQLECAQNELPSLTHGHGPADTYYSTPGQAVSAYVQAMMKPTNPSREMAQTYQNGGRAQYVLRYAGHKNAFVDVVQESKGWTVLASAECSPIVVTP
jgi:hypothetical protein